jgi:hypothetical protein
MINTAAEGELDANIMEYNYKAKAYATRFSGASQATYDEKLGNMYATSGMFKAGSSLLTAAGNMYAQGSMASAKTPAKAPAKAGGY